MSVVLLMKILQVSTNQHCFKILKVYPRTSRLGGASKKDQKDGSSYVFCLQKISYDKSELTSEKNGNKT